MPQAGVFASMVFSCWLIRCAFMLAALLALAQAESQELTKKSISMTGALIKQPEQISGLWETPVSSGHAVGIWLQLTTRIEGAATVLVGVAQYEQSFSVSLFQRTGNQLEFGGNAYFNYEDGDISMWDGNYLKARRSWRDNKVRSTEMDLRYDAATEVWRGLYRRGKFTKVVTLWRSGHAVRVGSITLAGTWASTDKWSHNCLHIAQQPDRTYAGWSDSLWTPGLFRYPAERRPPTSTIESYGNLVRINDLGKQHFSIEFVSLGLCCSQTQRVTLTGNELLSGSRQTDVNQGGGKPLWRRMVGDSCRVEKKRIGTPAESVHRLRELHSASHSRRLAAAHFPEVLSFGTR